jgi:hypothetical protein
MANVGRQSGQAPDYTLQLILAWAIVGIPLLWGIQQTWVNVQKLFATPPAATQMAPPPTK